MARGIAAVLPAVIALAMATDPSRGASPGASSSVVGITLSLRSPIGLSGIVADVVYFVRLDHGESLEDALARGRLIATQQARADRLMLLGAIPGTYLVASEHYFPSRLGPVPLAERGQGGARSVPPGPPAGPGHPTHRPSDRS